MKIETALSCGDKAWVYGDAPFQVTVGQVRVEYTNTKGVPGSVFANYKAQKGFEENYMCVETGIGSGTVWKFGKTIFLTEAECIEAHKELIAERVAQQAIQRRNDILYAQERKAAAERELRELGAA